jgi:indole-3-glycerol phosphate synthase
MKTILDIILEDTATEVAAAKAARPIADIRSRCADAPPPRDFPEALEGGFGFIAEIKERSPSVGPMRVENVRDCPPVYRDHPLVRAVSVLTNATHFGMGIDQLARVREVVEKPVLRKEFIIDEYQVREARAYGADAVLLMANVLDAPRLAGFYDLARELGIQALFEVHESGELESLPPGARMVGINSRKFKAREGFVGREGSSDHDFSVDFGAFQLAEELPLGCLKIAESGLTPQNILKFADKFDAALVGTSLLRDPKGVQSALNDFQQAFEAR